MKVKTFLELDLQKIDAKPKWAVNLFNNWIDLGKLILKGTT